jgi:F420H2:quinone oxidoreductase
MKPDVLGFLYPEIDYSKCINCGLCEKVCSFSDSYDKILNLPQPLAYAVRHKNIKEIEKSTSGAAFIAFSDAILERGGVVYGAGFEEHFRVVHKRATNKKERDEFRGSKYVQSDLSNIFSAVKNDLKNGLPVLFSGTPCQISGLASFIGKGKLRENLYLIDIVCHGVPSPYVWRDYLTYIENRNASSIIEAKFRDKSQGGWSVHNESFLFEDKKIYATNYLSLFGENIMLRHSCGECHFTNLQRPSDITIADYWGVERTNKEFAADNKGCSLMLINTAKGKTFFEAVQQDIDYIKAEIENCIQTNLVRPTTIHQKRQQFEQEYHNKGFLYVLKKYGENGWRYKSAKLKYNARHKFRMFVYNLKQLCNHEN